MFENLLKSLEQLSKLIPEGYRWTILLSVGLIGIIWLFIYTFSPSSIRLKVTTTRSKKWKFFLLRALFLTTCFHIYNLLCGIGFLNTVVDNTVRGKILFFLLLISIILFLNLTIYYALLKRKRKKLEDPLYKFPSRFAIVYSHFTFYSFNLCCWFLMMAADTLGYIYLYESSEINKHIFNAILLFSFPILYSMCMSSFFDSIFVVKQSRNLFVETPIGYKYLLEVLDENLYLLGDQPFETQCNKVYIYNTEKKEFKVKFKIE